MAAAVTLLGGGGWSSSSRSLEELLSSPLLNVDRLVLANTKCLIWRMTAVALYACCKIECLRREKNKNKIQINKRNTSIDLKEERWQSFFVLPTCTRINRPKQNRNSYVIQANDCRALFANCLVNKHMQRNLSAATLSRRNEKRRSHYEESN